MGMSMASPTRDAEQGRPVRELVGVLAAALALKPAVAAAMDADSGLFGTLPELDSMAVATVLTAIEDHFGIVIDDDDVTGELFETVGSLAAFVAGKRGG